MDFLATPLRRKVLFTALYMSEGAPIGFIWWYLPTRLRAAGVPLERITLLTAVLVLPWVCKFLWAPLIDALRGPRWSFREWIVSTQVVMGLTLLPLVGVDPGSAGLGWLGALLVLHALAASTQDAAVDALAISSSRGDERGSINGWMQAGMLIGRSSFGGAALMVADRLGAAVVPLALVVVVWATMVLVILSREPATTRPPVRGAFRATLVAAARRRDTWLGLAFAGVSGAGFEAVGAVAGPYLIDRGLSPESVGQFLALPAVGAMLVGSLIGGVLSDRYGRRGTTAVFLVLCAASVLVIAGLPVAGTSLVIAALAMLYLGIGLFVASSYALFMDLTDPRLGATQFSAFMAATNGCESWSSFAVGRLASAAGYRTGFAVMALVSLGALPLLWSLGRAAGASPPRLRPAGETADRDA